MGRRCALTRSINTRTLLRPVRDQKIESRAAYIPAAVDLKINVTSHRVYPCRNWRKSLENAIAAREGIATRGRHLMGRPLARQMLCF